ncbi:MAG: hypothetical protein ACKO3U_03530 [Actinomycetota bacterium]
MNLFQGASRWLRAGLAGLAIISITITSAPSSLSAELEDELIKVPTETSVLNTGVMFRNTQGGFMESGLFARYPNDARNNFRARICTDMKDPICDDATSLYYSTFLPLCSISTSFDCVEKFVARIGDGKELTATLDTIQPSPSLSPYKADASKNLVGPGQALVFTIPGAEHPGGNRYLLSVALNGATPEGAHKPGQEYGNFTPYNIQMSVDAVDYVPATKPGEFQKGRWYFYEAEQKVSLQKNPFSTCAVEEDSFCMNKRAFPQDIRFQVVLRLRSSTNGWLYGRVQKPGVSIASIPGGERWDVSAAPVRIPQIWEFVPLSQMPSTFEKWKSENWEDVPGSQLQDSSTSPPSLVRIPNALNVGGVDTSIKWLNYWMPITGDKATATPGMWSIRNLGPSEMNNASNCYDSNSYKEKRVTGMVTSNAMITTAGPPLFDQKEQALIYQVAGPHFERDGKTLFRGTYDLIMRKDVARCLYKFTDAPIKASISVVSANGEEIVATEQIAERNDASGEWITLGKYGFTFSSKKLKVRFTQEKSAETKNSAAAAQSGAVVKPKSQASKKSIVCVKGKLQKIVTGAKPKCPTGFRTR